MQETGKQRSRRIDRGYYRAIDPFVQNKRLLGLGGLVVGSLYSLWAFTGVASPQISSGDLSNAHTAWDDHGCEKCHVWNVPIRPDAWGGRLPQNVGLNNAKCNTSGCHNVTAHYAEQSTPNSFESGDSCAECHREHMGKDLKLVELEDFACTRCHDQIQKHRVDEDPLIIDPPIKDSPIPDVATFSAKSDHPHPNFRSLENDYIGSIKFSHDQHLRLGQARSREAPIQKQFKNIDATFRNQYADNRRFTDDKLESPIQLQCADCHEPDRIADSESIASIVTEYGNGKLITSTDSNLTDRFLYYSPVRFDKHCIACHDLDNIPHGLDRKETEAAVAKITPVQTLQIIRKLSSPSGSPATEAINEKQAIDIQTRLSSLLSSREGCRKCHTLAPDDSVDIVLKSSIPDRWLKAANFSHGAHMMVQCEFCHKVPNDSGGYNSTTDDKIEPRNAMIASIEICRKCHISDPSERAMEFEKVIEESDKAKQEFEKGKRHLATADCVDCHRFHVDKPTIKATEPTVQELSQSDLVREYLMQGTRF